MPNKERSHADIPGWYEAHSRQDEVDNNAVHRFSKAMRLKLAQARDKGRSGWNSTEVTDQMLSDALRAHVEKGDPVDVANFCMFLHERGERIVPPEGASND